MSTLDSPPKLPDWADELRRRYLRGEASQFVLHNNVHDVLLYEGKLYSLTEFLAQVLLAPSKETILTYNVSTGVRFGKRKMSIDGFEDLVLKKAPADVLPLLEKALTTQDRIAVILEYADTIAPAGDTSFSTVDDRSAAVTLHRWSLMRALEQSDSLVVLSLENLTDLHPKLVSNPRIATVKVPMPRLEERYALIRFLDPALSESDVARLADGTAGLKLIQIKAILAPESAATEGDREERRKYITALLSGGPTQAPSKDTIERADKLATMTQGMTKDAIRKLIAPETTEGGKGGGRAPDARAEIDRLVAARKREIIERECMGLIEFVEPEHGFEVVGGMEEIKKDLLQVAQNMREGRRNRCPMGILFTGPMGTGKTFVAEAFSKECGLTAIKLKNFRSKWVGATEGNLERILSVIRAIGQIIVIIDEGDRAFGGNDGDGDGGTSSRVIARIKEFMSDTENRGRVLFLLMTNRPDKLDVDIKRAGRFDRKIPFLYPQTGEEVERVVLAQLRKHKVKTTLEFPRDRSRLEKLVGYSNADLEAVVMLANDYAFDQPRANDARGGEARSAPPGEGGRASPPLEDAAVTPAELDRAVIDYMPARDNLMLEFMELLAVFEASNRRMLPKKYADVPVAELQQRMAALRAQVGNRR